MSKEPRPSLTQLSRTALPERRTPAVSAELEVAVLGEAVQPVEIQQTAAAPAVQQAEIRQMPVQKAPVQFVEPEEAPMPGPGTRLVPRRAPRRGEPTQSVTYRMPLGLYNRLVDVSNYYRVNMTDVVVEAIEKHLLNFPLDSRKL